MKGKLIALSLIAASGLMADYDDDQSRKMNRPTRGSQDQPMYQDSCDPCAPACEPCCVPQPRKCINIEAYNPSYYMLQCDWGAFISVDFLYWFARENNAPFAVEVHNTPLNTGAGSPLTFVTGNSHEMQTRWAPGFRAGLGWNSSYDGWDASAVYTWYRGTKHTTASVSGPFVAANPDIPPSGGFGLLTAFVDAGVSGSASSASATSATTIYDSVTGKFNFRFQQVDGVVGRKFWTSKHFTIRPFGGVRGTWTRTKFSTTSSFSSVTTLNRNFSDKFTDRYWGVGIVAGMDSNFYFGCDNAFSFYGSADLGLIYGKYKSSKKENYSQTTTLAIANNILLSNSFHNTFFQMVPMIDLGLGFSWQDFWSCDRFRTELDIGWEHHVMLGLIHRLVTFGSETVSIGTPPPAQQTFKSYDVINADTQFGGLVVRLRFDF